MDLKVKNTINEPFLHDEILTEMMKQFTDASIIAFAHLGLTEGEFVGFVGFEENSNEFQSLDPVDGEKFNVSKKLLILFRYAGIAMLAYCTLVGIDFEMTLIDPSPMLVYKDETTLKIVSMMTRFFKKQLLSGNKKELDKATRSGISYKIIKVSSFSF